MRILIASFNVGAGHAQSAQAIQAALQAEHPDIAVSLLDVLGCLPWVAQRTFSNLYLSLIRHCPEVWGMVFRKTDDPAYWRRRNARFPGFSRMAHRRLLQAVAAQNPDLIVCTHFLHLDLLAREYCLPRHKPLACVVTDFEAHGSWLNSRVNQYFVATERVRNSLSSRGLPRERVLATGIPIHPRFSQEISWTQARAQFGLRQDLPVVAVLGGGLGLGPMEKIMAELDRYPRPLQIVGAAGRNEGLQPRLRALMKRQPAKVLGFLDNMHELLQAADLIITKPGGLTSSEALARQCPMLLINPIPGQEMANSDFLLEHGAAAKVNRIADLNPVLTELLDQRLPAMKIACLKLGKPRAAFEVADWLASCRNPESCLELA
jgi:processive 1,2-diacylglycerol beta-glucosyltransferase